MGHTLHLAIAVPAPGFSAGEDTKVTKHTSGVKLPLSICCTVGIAHFYPQWAHKYGKAMCNDSSAS